MTTPIAYIVLDESSPRLIAGQYQFDRVCSGALIIPSGSDFPGDPFAGELFWRTSNSSLYRRNTANTAWEQASGGGGDTNASYIVVGNTGSLSAERALSSSLGVLFDDNGANSNFVIRINESEVPILSASNTFTGPNLFSGGLSGSLTHLADGTSYISGAGSIAVITQSNGSLLISGTDTSPGGTDRQLQFNDSDSFGGNTNLWLDSSNNLLASGSITTAFGFSGSLTRLSDGTSAFIAGPNITISSASNGAVTIQSSIGAGDLADIDASYIVIGNTASLPNERAATSSLGVQLIDNGANSTIDFRINEDVVPVLSASNIFTGLNTFNADIDMNSNDLLNVNSISATSFTGDVDMNSNGIISSSLLQVVNSIADVRFTETDATANEQNWVLRADGDRFSLRTFDDAWSVNSEVWSVERGGTLPTLFSHNTNVRILNSSPSIQFEETDAGIDEAIWLQETSLGSWRLATVNDAATITNNAISISRSGAIISTMTISAELDMDSNNILNSNNILASGFVTASLGFSGSLTRLSDGTSAFIAGPNITISSASNGAVTIQSEVGSGDIADIDASYIVVGNTASLPNERALSSSLGILLNDNGANSTLEVQINELEVPILSASNTFTGDISLSGGGLVLNVTGSTRITGSVYISGSSVDGDEFLFELDGSGSAEFHGNRIRHAGVAETTASEPDPFAEGMIWFDPSGSPGGIGGTIATDLITGSYTLVDDNTVIVANATSGHVTASLPTAVGRQGKAFYIKKIDASSNHVVIEPNGIETIDDSLNKTILVQYASLMIVSDNSEWWII